MNKHHPSCKPSDKDLVWHCVQCGENEPAEDVAAELERVKVAHENQYRKVCQLEQSNSELLAALKETLDALYNETAGKIDTRWIMTVKANASAAISKHEGRAP